MPTKASAAAATLAASDARPGDCSTQPRLDLGFLRAPGCPLLVQSLDLTIAVIGASPSMVSALPIPAGLPIGTQILSQGAALFAPNSLPNGQNAFGAETSNGIESRIGSW